MFVQCRHLEDKGGYGSSDADVHTNWCKNVFEIYVVSTWTTGSQCE